uniref:Neuronal PAS domain protein 3 n=1 Tax=Anolis carolinensis TaxID=28377 RepID=A0A803TV62_ANOCA
MSPAMKAFDNTSPKYFSFCFLIFSPSFLCLCISSKPEYKNTVLDVFQMSGIPAKPADKTEASTDFKDGGLTKESVQGKLYKAGTLEETYPRNGAEAGADCRMMETDSSGTEMNYREEEASECSDAEEPPGKRIKLEFQPESPPKDDDDSLPSSEDSDSGSESELDLLPQPRGALVKKVNGCKARRRKSLHSSRPSTSEFASVIQTQKSLAPKANPALSIKSEQVPGAKGGPWICPTAPKGGPYPVNKALNLERPTPRHASSHLYVSIPDSVLTPPEMESGAVKGPFGTSPRPIATNAPSSTETLSPPLSGSPCEERVASTPFTPLVYPAEMEVLQRFHASNVVVPLVHQLGSPHSGTAGSQGLYTTSTIRYAPADMTLAMQSNVLPPAHPLSLMDLGGAEAKTSRELMYHHLQRLNMVAPFGNSISGGTFTATDSLFSGLPFSVASSGLHGTSALERKED